MVDSFVLDDLNVEGDSTSTDPFPATRQPTMDWAGDRSEGGCAGEHGTPE
jgi:hypothetical protein